MKAYKMNPAGLVCIMLTCFCLSFSATADELDPSFGVDGRMATSVGNYEDNAYAVALQQDGKILLGGASSNGADFDFALVRYNQDGTLDSTFNFNGIATTQVGRGDDEIAALAVQDNGYIIAAGYSMQEGSRDFALVRYAPDGQRDPSFGLDGIVITGYGTLDDEITAITFDEEGRIVVAGYSTGTSGRAVIVARYLANGDLDHTFGYEGVSLTGIGDDALARSIDVDKQGRIIVAGSNFHADRTEVMVLRFTDKGELDTSFGEEGLGLMEYSPNPTEGFGVKVHESGGILVAGSVAGPGDLNAALFKFNENGQPDPGFGENGMFEIEAGPEDDMALAVDLKDDTVYLSGFTTVNGVRQFLFISLQVSSPETNHPEVAEIESVPFILRTGNTITNVNIGERQVIGSSEPFILRTGNTTANLHIGERQVVDSYAGFLEAAGDGMIPVQTTISQAAFGILSDDTSYALAVQPDGMAVTAGVSEENGVVSFAVARFAGEAFASGANAVSADTPTSWLETKAPFEITRTGAISGGIITDSGISIVQRGVVFSIAPDPVLKTGGSDGGNGGTDTTPPVITAPTATLNSGSTTEATLSATTNENATCRHATTAGVSFANMTHFTTTGGTSHTTSLTGVSAGTDVFIKCQDSSGNTSAESRVSISSATARVNGIKMNTFDLQRVAARVGGFVIGTAQAQTTGNPDTTTTSVFDLSTGYVEEGFTEDGSGTGRYSSIIKNLKPGTMYYVRAYAVSSDGTIYYGNQVDLKTPDSCFIATAAYGSVLHSSVKLLRAFRDQYLVTNVPGRMFVQFYYKYSPPVADIIAGSPILREIVRVLLLPLVGISWLILNMGAAGILLVAALFLLPYLIYRGAWHRAKENR